MKKTISFLLPALVIAGFAFRYGTTRLPVVMVRPDKMNVFYRGLDNPITVEAEGVEPEDISVTVSGGDATVERGAGMKNFIVKVTEGYQVMVNVGQRIDTTIKSLGSYMFRVKKIPDPVLYVYNHKRDDTIPAIDLQNQLGIFAKMENFDFDCSFMVESFGMSIYHDTAWHDMMAKGPVFSLSMKQQMKLLEHGDRVIFHDVNIKVKAPAGDSSIRRIPGCYFVIR